MCIRDRVEARNAKIKDDRELELELDEDIAQIFFASTAVGGRCNFFLLIASIHNQVSLPRWHAKLHLHLVVIDASYVQRQWSSTN